jgi:hypothetical protein
MKIASVNEIKEELGHLSQKDLVRLCLQLAKSKKENKELLTYLLFEAHDLQGYISSVKNQMDEQFSEVNSSSLYFAKKTLRKILRIANKYIRHTGSKEAEAEILIHYCQSLVNSGIPFKKSTALNNIYLAQLKKIRTAIDSLHEELAYEYVKQLEALT